MMKQLFFLIVCSIPLFASAQTIEITNEPLDVIVYLVNLNNRDYNSVEGSPYAKEEFSPAKIKGEEKVRLIRLNLVDDIVEVQQSEQKIMQLRLRENLQISFLDNSKKEIVVKSYQEEGNLKKMLFEKLGSIKHYTLYKKERKKYVPKKKTEAYQDNSNAHFITLPDTFYITDFKASTADLVELPRKKKKFFAFFGEYGKQLERFSKIEKLDYRNNKDLLQLMDYYFKDLNSSCGQS